MITTEDVRDILISKFREKGYAPFKSSALPDEEIKDERVVVISNAGKDGTYWTKSFPIVNFCVPNIFEMADTGRMSEIQRDVYNTRGTGEYDGTFYRFKRFSMSEERDKDGRYHFVKLVLLFEILNTI